MPTFSKLRPSSPLPKEADFGGCLDGQEAWRNFGGLSLEQAYDKFIGAPALHQEDFMFMRYPSFEYYFPVLDRYLREVKYEGDYDDYPAGILGHVMIAYLDDFEAEHPSKMIKDISDLSSFVQSSLANYTEWPEEQLSIGKVWGKVDKKLRKKQS